LFEKIARILHAPIVGIDFIIEDISRSWEEQEGCGVIECNGKPFFDNHHLPFEGKPQNIAEAIWDLWELV
jgi:glutathione synthase/RimK-type ligase-like ATP-grasp enzyme